MPGPLPKDPRVRQRRNKKVSHAQLPTELAPIEQVPALPNNPLGDWNDLTRQWWGDIWNSPLRGEFLRADLGALFRLAALVDRFWKLGKLADAAEVRLLEREFGLTPMARRRLEWSVTVVEEAKVNHEQKRAKGGRVIEHDPREVLTQ